MKLIKTIIRQSSFYKKWQQNKHEAFKKQQEEIEKRLLPERIAFYQQFISSNDLVFDVGANTGNRVQIFLELNAKIVAVEPQPACVAILKRKFGDKIIVEEVGLSNEVGELDMHIANDSTISSFSEDFIKNTGNSRFNNYSWNEIIKVPITTLDTLIEVHGRPQFCKIDVEGFELNVLKGLNYKIPFLSFEYCVPEMMENMLQCINVLNRLSPQGSFNYSIAESMKLASANWMNYDEIMKIIHTDQFVNTLFGDIYFKS